MTYNNKNEEKQEKTNAYKISERTFEFVYWGLSATMLLLLALSAFAWGIFPIFYILNSLFG